MKNSFKRQKSRVPSQAHLEALAWGVEELAADWIGRHLVCFNPLSQINSRRMKFAIKAASELALLCGIALKNTKNDGLHRYHKWAHYLWSNVMSVEAFQEHLIANATGLPAFSLYASLRQCGYEDEEFRSRLQKLLDARYILFSERIPAVQLDLLHSVVAGEFDQDEIRMEDLYQRTMLSSCPTLYPLTTLDVYAMTHTVFFLSDFGEKHIRPNRQLIAARS